MCKRQMILINVQNEVCTKTSSNTLRNKPGRLAGVGDSNLRAPPYLQPPEWLRLSLKTFPNLVSLELGHGSQPTVWTADMIPPGVASRLTSLTICLNRCQLELPRFECLTRIKSLAILNRGPFEGQFDIGHSDTRLGFRESEWVYRPQALTGLEIIGRLVLPYWTMVLTPCAGIA